jgi:hypothetical protein
VAPRAAAHGIKLSARELHAWSVSLSIALSQSKAHYRMPATRMERPVQKKAPAKSVQTPKSELFPRTEQPAAPFAEPNIAPALRKLRRMLREDSIQEAELISILRDSTPQGAVPPACLEETAPRSLELLLSRWSVVKELVETSRQDSGEAA